MIYHHVRLALRADVRDEDRDRTLASLRHQGEVIDAVEHCVVGRELGGEYEWGAVFAIADLEGFWQYLIHPAHLDTDRVGLPLVRRLAAHDTTDDPDPGIGAKIAALYARRSAELPDDVRELFAGLDAG